MTVNIVAELEGRMREYVEEYRSAFNEDDFDTTLAADVTKCTGRDFYNVAYEVLNASKTQAQRDNCQRYIDDMKRL